MAKLPLARWSRADSSYVCWCDRKQQPYLLHFSKNFLKLRLRSSLKTELLLKDGAKKIEANGMLAQEKDYRCSMVEIMHGFECSVMDSDPIRHIDHVPPVALPVMREALAWSTSA